MASDATEQTRFSALRQKAFSLTAIAVVGIQYASWFPKPQFPKGESKGGQGPAHTIGCVAEKRS